MFDQTKLTGLPIACNSVYTSNISSCTSMDFLPTMPCSSACLSALNGVQPQAQAACAGVTGTAGSLLNMFIQGAGVKSLCTTDKQGTNTMATSITNAQATGAAAGTASAGPQITGGDTSMSLPSGTVVAIVVAVVIASIVLIIVGVVIYRHTYMK
jgi:hypothetical protein